MTERYLIVETATGEIVNATVWDGESEWSPPEGCEAVRSDIGGPGWSMVDGVPIPPPPVEPEPRPDFAPET